MLEDLVKRFLEAIFLILNFIESYKDFFLMIYNSPAKNGPLVRCILWPQLLHSGLS